MPSENVALAEITGTACLCVGVNTASASDAVSSTQETYRTAFEQLLSFTVGVLRARTAVELMAQAYPTILLRGCYQHVHPHSGPHVLCAEPLSRSIANRKISKISNNDNFFGLDYLGEVSF